MLLLATPTLNEESTDDNIMICDTVTRPPFEVICQGSCTCIVDWCMVMMIYCTVFRFQPYFISCKKSLYRQEYSFHLHQDQKGILEDAERNIQDANHEPYDYDLPILHDNPCHFDNVYFSGIETFGKYLIGLHLKGAS